MRIFVGIPWRGRVKQQWDGQNRRFLVISVAISSNPLELKPMMIWRPKLLKMLRREVPYRLSGDRRMFDFK